MKKILWGESYFSLFLAQLCLGWQSLLFDTQFNLVWWIILGETPLNLHSLIFYGILTPLTRALMGLWIFHHLMGGVWTPPSRLSRLLRIVEQNGKRRSKAREKSFRNHFGHFLAQFKIEVTRSQNSKIFQNGFWTIKSLILKVEQRFWYHRVCLVKARRTMYNLTLKGQGQNLTSGQLRARSLGDSSRSNYTSFDAPCGDKHNDTNPTSLSHLVLKLLAKNCWWPRVTSMTFRGVTD